MDNKPRQLMQLARVFPDKLVSKLQKKTHTEDYINHSVITQRLLQVCGPFDWDIEVLEMHHKHKVDSPSGTALLLGKSAADARHQELSNVKSISRDGLVGKRKVDEIGFAVLRGGDVVGEHSVLFCNSGERIELAHKATDRSIFASGALRASYWAANAEPGLYSLADVLENGG